MNEISVSVIVPVYNVKKYINQCLDTIVNQTLKNIEIILVDDCSNDGTSEILDEYATCDDRIMVIHNEHKIGAGGARNLGLKMARGEYLSFLDSDDFFALDLLEKVYFECKKNELDICIYDYAKYDDINKRIDSRYQISAENEKLIEDKVFSFDTMGDRIMPIWTCAMWTRMVRRKMIIKEKLQFQQIHNANDVFFSYATLLCAKRIKYVKYQDPLLYYRVNIEGQLSNIRTKSPYCIYEALLAVTQYYRERNTVKLEESFYKCIVGHLMNSIKSVDGEKRPELIAFYRDEGLENLGLKRALEERKINGYHYKYVTSILNYNNGEEFATQFRSDDTMFNNKEKSEILKGYLKNTNEAIYLWGAGKLGQLFLEECNRRDICLKKVIDKDTTKQGTKLLDYFVVAPEYIYGKAGIVLITNTRWFDEILDLLKKQNFSGNVIDLYSFYGCALNLEECIVCCE